MSAQLLVGIPLLTAVACLGLARRAPGLAVDVAAATAVLTLVVALVQVFTVGDVASSSPTFGPLPVGRLDLPLHLLSDRLSAVVAVAVGVVAAAVQVFSRWYLHADSRKGVFAATVALFTSAMLLVVQAGDLVLLLAGWEVMGWCSFLLVGHDSAREAARRAAVKAFLVTRVADLAFVIGIIVLAVGARSTSIAAVLAHWTGVLRCIDTAGCLAPSSGTLTVAMVCLLSGIAGKSALFPFHDWLPDAMEGPTPASALIHAATMVAAGTFVLARLFPLFAASDSARLLLAMLTVVTMVGAALLAFAQSDLKRLLAYSTLSQIALMLSALAVVPAPAGPSAGVFHLLSHAMFKALLFLTVGWLSALAGGTALARLAGTARRHTVPARLFAIGLLALVGVPPLVGFVSKEYVVSAAEEGILHGRSLSGALVLAGLLVTVALTAAYCTRAWLVVYGNPPEAHGDALGDARGEDHGGGAPARPLDAFTLAALAVLSLLTVLGGLVVATPLLDMTLDLSVWTALLTLLLIAGAAMAVVAASREQPLRDPAARLGDRPRALADAGLRADAVYVAVVARPVVRLAHLVVAADRDVIDAYVRGSAVAVRWGGRGGERAHTRKPSAYLVWVLLGMLAVAVTGVSLW